ncbi:receptor-type tyrosine-protein phosphatase eta-like isoform X2 [Trichechus manatus latirostris]|uniref:Receptor-type tyrosine-protein phosphatase eta n=1 Tax=Trichechus manatus latirostris TaxID=127582 RepID=A0A2Y9RZT7_TRIMA|nr:receptor-type tyrosine-protein phosphatase eta-like isoform X2 [Trichechus manatus latirostris]
MNLLTSRFLFLFQIACTGDVSDFRVTSVSTTEIGLTRSNNDSGSIKILTTRDGAGEPRNETTTNHSIITGGLSLGTTHRSEIFPQGPNGTQGPPQTVEGQTESSAVSDIPMVRVTPPEMELKWQSIDTASQYTYQLGTQSKVSSYKTVGPLKAITPSSLMPSTLYNITITPEMGNVPGKSSFIAEYTQPNPVSGLHVTFMGTTKVTLTWCSDNGTAKCRMLLESIGSQKDSTQDSVFNISDLEPGNRYQFPPPPVVSNETQKDPEDGVEANNTERSPAEKLPSNHTAPVYLGTAASSCHQGSRGTEVQLVGLKPGTQYKATVYSQAADGTEGQPQVIEFRTNRSQVLDIQVVNISATNMSLTWRISGNASSYQILVVRETTFFNLTANEMHVVIPGLTSSTLYNITVYPLHDDGSEGTPGFLQAYTPPGPVSDFRVTSVNTTEIGLAWSSNDSDSFKILTTRDGAGEPRNETTTNHSIIIGGLNPGTKYHFEIFPQGPNGTQGPPQTVEGQTESSVVFGIRVVRVTTTEMELKWESTDTTFQYIYRLDIQPEVSCNKTVGPLKEITLSSLMPGTLYNITITPEMGDVPGTSSSIAEYTRPSSVSNIEINTTTTAAAFSWQNFDNASSTYTYRLLISGNSSNPVENITGVGTTYATVCGLIPGSSYTVEIFAQVGNVTEGASSSASFCTDAAPVNFSCEPVPKEPTLVLTWALPPGNNAGFKLEVSSGACDNMTCLENCSLENGTSCMAEVTHLNFCTSYNISITTLSCGKNASSVQKTCTTDSTDPPPPAEAPVITPVSHNSIKVTFSEFNDSHGPIKAYALILTTGKAKRPSPNVLKYTYEDFKKEASDTYVTYLITTDENYSQGLSEVLKYEIDVGNESTTCGYRNGKLEPLSSYRASVAGFTKIVFNCPQNCGLINGTRSYVSFSEYSKAIDLPQDPGVICGAVFGCIFGALVVAVGGFIFWRNKRKDEKNNEMSFSQIKSKLIKVENFEAYFKKQQADSNCGFAEEYEDLKLVGISQPKYAAELAENRGKNRYNNVLPYDVSRVKLSVQTHSTDDYINANYMPGYHSKKEFIAMQGPLPNTLKDFWRMVWEKNVYAIVMLTKCVEQGRTKCEEYWPSKEAQDYGDITVAMSSEIIHPEWTIRDFTVKNVQTRESHPVRQFHFTSWPDHGVPETTDLLISFRYLVRDYVTQSPPETPILVHCSAGVGRTGTFIAIDRLIYQIENENTVDVYGIVYDLRMHRPLMVQTEDQYVFLNQCVLDIIRSRKDSKVDLIYQNTTAMTIYENFMPGPRFGKTNGYIA